nr:hypothetical protein [Vespula vulgaris Moku-like virus]
MDLYFLFLFLFTMATTKRNAQCEEVAPHPIDVVAPQINDITYVDPAYELTETNDLCYIQNMIDKQPLVMSGVYRASKVAAIMDIKHCLMYSVNYLYIKPLKFDINTIFKHRPFLIDMCPSDLQFIKCSMAKLNIDGKEVIKIQALYKKFVMAATFEGPEVIVIDSVDTIVNIWDNMCNKCQFVGAYYKKYKKCHRVMLYRKRQIGCCCLPTMGVYIEMLPVYAEFESAGVTDGQEEIPTSNVVLAETQQTSIDLASEPVIPSWHALSSSEFSPSFSDMCDRFIPWLHFTWSISDFSNRPLVSKILPKDFVNSHGKYCNTVNFVPFNVHAYWRGDIEIKVHVNSNMFQSGQLIGAWLYASDSFMSSSGKAVGPRYSNIAQLVQKPHIIINAGASNEATLHIPYRYVKPFMRTKVIYSGTAVSLPSLNMGRFILTPMVPLMTGTSKDSPQECNGTVFVRLINNAFTGKFSGTIARPEMAGVVDVVKKVVGTVDKVLGDVNCDNPPDPRSPPFWVPINAQNWSHGTKTREPINTLRLDGRVIGCGRSSDIGYSETNIKRIANVFGLLSPFVWDYTDKKTNIAGHQLWGMAVHPQCDKDRMFFDAPYQDFLATYTVPPVGVVASLFCYWRGSIDFKFEIVATAKHTGRILVAYIPGVTNYSKVTLQQAMSSSNVEFSLNTGTTAFTFRVPYIAETMWWPRKYGGPQRADDFIAPSSIVIFILNPLVPMESVAQKVTFLPYVAAGPDFEVSIPAQPSIGLAYNRRNEVPSSDIIEFKEGYYPVYMSSWHNYANGAKLIFRYGNVTDHVAQITNLVTPQPGTVMIYYFVHTDILRYSVKTSYDVKSEKGVYTDPNTGCSFSTLDGKKFNGVVGCAISWSLDGYNYLVPFLYNKDAPTPNRSDAVRAAQITAAAIARREVDFYECCCSYYEDSGWLGSTNIRWKGASTPPCSVKREMMEETYVTPNPLQPTNTLPTTRDGVVTFGERFFDLKDLCRRYQLYWEGTIVPGQIRTNSRNVALVQLPVMPQGLYLDASLTNPVWNSMREGHIPIISSGFRFYRGGVRFRIVVTGLNDSVWVQHHPDRYFTQQTPLIGKEIADKDAYRNHAYGFHVQNMSVNRTIEVEIPFYKPGLYNLLGDVGIDFDSKEYGTLGDVVIGVEGDQALDKPIDVAVYYTIADDCSFNIFCGFPDMVFCDEVYKPLPKIIDELEEAAIEQDFEKIDIPVVYAHREMMSVSGIASSGMNTLFGNLLGNLAFKGSKVVTEPIANVVKEEVKTHVLPVMKDIEKEVRNAADDISNTLGRTLPQQAIISALGQFSQVALNPTPASLAIAITSLLANFVTISMELIISLQQILTTFLNKTWQRYFVGASDHQEARQGIVPEGFVDDMPEKSLHGFLGMLFTAVASTIGLTCATPKRFPDVMKGVKECLNTCNAAIVFFKNTVDAIVYMYKYCLGETSEELRAKIIIEREYPHMKDWCNEVMLLLDPRNQNVILHSSRQANRVFDACIYGAKLINENLDKNVPGGKVIYDLYTKICKVRDDLIELGNHPDVRFEAFPIWVCGEAGVGKSHITQQVCQDLLQHIDYQTQECMIYWLALGQKYWNGIKNPPVIARDEAYAVGGQFTEEEIATHLAICSCSILNPPMAALQEKNKRLNPLIYYMNSNLEFPQINEARHPEAIYRRRKLMVRVRYTPDVKNAYPNIIDASELPPSVRENMNHLEFYIARDPKHIQTTFAGPYNYAAFIRIAKERFANHVNTERINFRNRMAAAYALDPDYNVEDELNYVHGSTLSPETLHDLYLAQRNEARKILYAPPPTIEESEDPYLSKILQRFSYLWTPPDSPQPEMSDPCCSGVGNSLSSRKSRVCADKLGKSVKLDRGALLKLVSGGVEVDDQVIADFIIDPDFERLIKSVRNKHGIWSRFCCGFEYNSMLPDEMTFFFRRTLINDSAHGTHMNVSKILPHWEDVTGVDAIRSYVYWLMREWQFRTYARILFERGDTLDKVREEYAAMMAETTGFARRKVQDILNCRDINDFLVASAALDNPNGTEMSFWEMWLILKYMDELAKARECEFCMHCRFWVDKIRDTSDLEYVHRFDTLLYTNTLGLRSKCTNFCDCKHALTNNTLYRNAMRIIWNNDHGTNGHDFTNPFAFAEHKSLNNVLDAWYVRVYEWAKAWWKSVAQPFISMILTFIYEHLGSIITILLSLYALYKVYNSSLVKPVVDYAAEKTVENVTAAAGAFMATVIAKHDVVTEEVVQQEAAGYCKIEKPKPAAANFNPAAKEGETSVERIEILENKLINNVCFLEARWNDDDGNAKMLYGRCLGIRERQVLVLKHYIEEMLTKPLTTTFMLNYVMSGKPCTGFLTRECVQSVTYFKINGKSNASNFGILRLPKFMPMFKDILNSIVRKADHHYVANEGHITSIDMEGRITRHRQMQLRPRAFLVIEGESDGSVSSICNDGAYEYSVHGKGMCGSLLISDKVCRGNPGIVAVHVAGARGNGYAEPIYREMFEQDRLKPSITYVLPQFGDAAKSSIDLDSNLLTLGIVDRKLSHHESGKSKIVPSLLHGKIYPVLTEPNPLRPNDPRQPPGSHPLRDGCNKHGFGFSIPFAQNLLDKVSHNRRVIMKNTIKNPLATFRQLTLEEAICGTNAIPHCESLNWKSSEGFPLSSFRPTEFHNKKYLFDLEETNEGYRLKGLAPELQKILQVRQQLRDDNVCIPPIYIDCLKDYRLTPAKCAIPGKTRIFSIAPVQVTIDLRRYMGVFLSAYRSAGVEAQHGIGINVDSLEWTRLAHYLHEVGDNIVTGDYTNFGPTLSSQIVYAVIQDIMDWHEFNDADLETMKNLRFILENEILNPVHLCSELVYQTVNGIASGSPITAELNSEVNIRYLMLAFLLLVVEHKLQYTLADFNSKVRLVTYGDDFIMSVHDDFIKWYNCKTISDVLKSHGIILTDASKGREIISYRSLLHSTFLKRSFKPHPFRPGIWLAPIEEQSITECLNWCHKQTNMKAATEEVIRASCLLAFGHGPEYYKKHVNKIHKAAQREGLIAEYLSWEELDEQNFG